jgi:hypothetical protein
MVDAYSVRRYEGGVITIDLQEMCEGSLLFKVI